MFVSIHLNKIPQSQYWGWQTFFKQNNEESIRLAKNIQNGLNETIQKENKRESLKIENKYLVEHVDIPITIVDFYQTMKKKICYKQINTKVN